MEDHDEKNLHSGHRDRLREMIAQNGFDGMPDHVILEFLLFHAIPRKDTNPIAHRLIDRFGNLQGVMDADETALLSVKGVGRNAALLLRSIPLLTKRYTLEKVKRRDNYTSIKKAGEYLVKYYISKTVEEVTVMLLDNSDGLIAFESLQEGTVNSTPVTPRKIAERAFKYNASSLILAHNHPFGTVKPSNDDLDTTRHIVNSLMELDLTVKAHIVVAGNKYRDIMPDMYSSMRFAPKYIVVESGPPDGESDESDEDNAPAPDTGPSDAHGE
ncbi:MAG: RadC family protein [Clostridia bacterium]|nr:RadC family protein [Clostridia bacterium]